MLLRFILNFIKPSNEQLRNKSNGKFIRFKIGIYQWLLRRLLKTYLHYAVSDSIIINDGEFKIVHEFRDVGFENELIRNRIGFKTEMISHSIPVSVRKSKAVHHSSYFKFKNLLSLYVDGKELFIKHDEVFSIDGTVKGEAKCSINDSFMSQSIIKIMRPKKVIEPLNNAVHRQVKPTTNNNTLKQGQKKTTPLQNRFGREREITPITAPKVSGAEKTEIKYDDQSKPIEKKGFDIDTSF